MKRALGIACCLLLVGCSSVVVYKDVPGKNGWNGGAKQPGIPFYLKKAEVVHTTKVQIEQASIRFKIEYPERKLTIDFPSAGAISVRRNKCLDDEIRNITDTLDNIYSGTDLPKDSIVGTLSNYQRKLEACDKKASRQTVVANTWKTGTVIDTTQYWLNPKRPIIGSTTVSAELASDGTLTKTSVAVQDDTLSTLIPLLPITKYFERRLGLSDTVADADTAKATRKIEFSHFAVRPKTPREEIKISMAVAFEPTVYTLEEHLDAGECSKSCPALELKSTDSDFVPSNDKVQLVSVETSSEGKKDDDTAYSISGKIVPPKPAKTDAPAGTTPPP